ncbi:MAG: DUF72 domain-containing protein [Caldilineaceae bacterium]|nr:DUF72 domain-containing protein [Caldilineaceae bacterium]
MASIHLGTSSWQFDEWRGVFFPPGVNRPTYLNYYASQFNSVEVNTTFYGIPRPTTLLNWVESVPQGFTFCLKFPRAITHEKRLEGCEQETLVFLDILRALGVAAAPALLQFPPDFSRQLYGRRLADYLEWLAGVLEGLRVGVEVRAPDLMTPAFATYLAERGLAYVLVDRVESADAFPFWWALIEQGAAPAFALVRWIGDDKNGPTGNDALVAPRDEQLDQWAIRIAQLQAANVDFFGYMHNPYEGHSPASLRRLQERLAQQVSLLPWPPEGDPPMSPAQMSLF